MRATAVVRIESKAYRKPGRGQGPLLPARFYSWLIFW